jgi:hypothetical protein
VCMWLQRFTNAQKEDAKIVEALLLFGAQTVGLTLKCITSYSWQKMARTRLKTQLLCVRIATVRLISANNEGETDPSPT